MTPETEEHLARVGNTVKAAKDIIGKHGYPDDMRTVIVMGLLDQMREHNDSILLLIRSGHVGSAFALARGTFENLYRGLWFNFCATDAEIAQFEKEDRLPRGLTMDEMAKVIDATYRAGDFFKDFKKRAWGPMCSFAHTGLLQLGRRFNDDVVEGVYSDKEIYEVTTTATTCFLMLTGRFLAAQNHAEESKAAEDLIPTYGPLREKKKGA